MVLESGQFGDQCDGSGLVGRRVMVELKGKIRKGRVDSLAGRTVAGMAIYMVKLDRRLRPDPFLQSDLELIAQGEWGFEADD